MTIALDILTDNAVRTARAHRIIATIDRDPSYSVPMHVYAGTLRAARKSASEYDRALSTIRDAKAIRENMRQATMPILSDTVNAGPRGNRPVMLVTFASDANADTSALALHLLRLASLTRAIEDHSQGSPEWDYSFIRADGKRVRESFDGFTITRKVYTPMTDAEVRQMRAQMLIDHEDTDTVEESTEDRKRRLTRERVAKHRAAKRAAERGESVSTGKVTLPTSNGRSTRETHEYSAGTATMVTINN